MPQWQLAAELNKLLLLRALHFGFERFDNRREVMVSEAEWFRSFVQLVSCCNSRNGLGYWLRQGQRKPQILSWFVCLIIIRKSVRIRSDQMQMKLLVTAECMDKQIVATFCWCFRGKAVGYAALTMDGPFRENMGALIAPCEITWKDQSTRLLDSFPIDPHYLPR